MRNYYWGNNNGYVLSQLSKQDADDDPMFSLDAPYFNDDTSIVAKIKGIIVNMFKEEEEEYTE